MFTAWRHLANMDKAWGCVKQEYVKNSWIQIQITRTYSNFTQHSCLQELDLYLIPKPRVASRGLSLKERSTKYSLLSLFSPPQTLATYTKNAQDSVEIKTTYM